MSTGDPIIISCSAGPPCAYLRLGCQWECSFHQDCEYQRPRMKNNLCFKYENAKRPEIDNEAI